jgi:Cu+-exporting ATPase
MSAKVTDPVCGMAFPPEKAAAQIERGGVTYYFCTAACKQQFEADPDRYATPGAGR